MNREEYYVNRMLNLVITNPNVDSFEEDEVEEYAADLCGQLCLDSETFVPQVLDANPGTNSINTTFK